jgi:sigma-B regulation protein RsbU (phosphoserine phosphatase)
MIARQVYLGLLPERDPEFEGLEISGACISADTVGGDYYGYHKLPDGGLGIAMADVTGHGIGAAMYMAAMKGVFQAESRRVISPADLLRRANEALESDFSRSDIFATAFFAHFAPGATRFEYALGGHNPPMLIRACGKVEMLDRGGIALGILPDVQYEETTCLPDAGDTLVVYTDGLPEARDEQRNLYGMDRFRQLSVANRMAGAEEIRDRLLEDLMKHTAGRSPSDDVTLMVVKFLGGPAPTGGPHV